MRNLNWGDEPPALQDELEKIGPKRLFDTAVAAHLVHPSTANQVMRRLFDTVDTLLAESGTCFLSFFSQDCTPNLLRVPLACHCTTSNRRDVKAEPPPLLGAKLLLSILCRHVEARMRKETLGNVHHAVFPGLQAAIERASEESRKESWDEPSFLDEEDTQNKMMPSSNHLRPATDLHVSAMVLRFTLNLQLEHNQSQNHNTHGAAHLLPNATLATLDSSKSSNLFPVCCSAVRKTLGTWLVLNSSSCRNMTVGLASKFGLPQIRPLSYYVMKGRY